MIEHIDNYLSGFDFENGEHNFFFPPYSSLFWCHAQDSGYFDTYLQAKQYFVERATEYGAIVYDFQSAEFTMELDNYRDTTHYTPEINNWMVECFTDHEYVITKNNSNDFQDRLRINTDNFRNAHIDLFDKKYIYMEEVAYD